MEWRRFKKCKKIVLTRNFFEMVILLVLIQSTKPWLIVVLLKDKQGLLMSMIPETRESRSEMILLWA